MTASILSIDKLNPGNLPFPAYFVASTAPINVEDEKADSISEDSEPKILINEICQYLKQHKGDAEVLIAIHGYNTSNENAKIWIESIYEHLASRYSKSRSQGLILIGYRWPSEQISAELPKSITTLKDAKEALPAGLGVLFLVGSIGLLICIVGLFASIFEIGLQVTNAIFPLIISFLLTIFCLILISPIFTILALRLGGYFRDSYRASNFGVSDLVELIRQIDHNLVKVESAGCSSNQEVYSDKERIKLSFIGHSMGGFVVTDTVRILSNVFDPGSIGSLDLANAGKTPSSLIGNVFSLARLVLVSPDIPADTIVSGRSNSLQSSLRRFQETYLFSNEGDMALRLGSTAANYFSYPSQKQEGGYRLGNVSFRNSTDNKVPESYGMIVRLPDEKLVNFQDPQEINDPEHKYPLDYLYLKKQNLSERRDQVAPRYQMPIGELFTFFDCTDYAEKYLDQNGQAKTAGLVSRALRKQTLTLCDYISLTLDYFSGKIDTHWGYFSDGKTGLKPEATFTKIAIYGLACIGFEKFLWELQEEAIFDDYQESFEQILQDLKSKSSNSNLIDDETRSFVSDSNVSLPGKGSNLKVFIENYSSQTRRSLTPDQQQKLALSQILSNICRDKGIQVLLAKERYSLDVLGRAESLVK